MEIKDLFLPDNLLLIEEHPVVVAETSGGVMLNPERIAALKAARRFRTGVILAKGYIESKLIPTSLFKGKQEVAKTEDPLPIGTTIIYDANLADLFDVPLSDTLDKRLITINASYMTAVVDVDTDTPNTID